MDKKVIKGVFADGDMLKEAVQELNEKGITIRNVYSPFPIHGIDKLLGIKPTRLSIAAFIYGATGTSMALLMMWFMMVSDWPMNIGGKPNFTLLQNLPAFIPITFEITVLFAAHGMVITFLLVSKILPGATAYVSHPRVTDDKLVIEVEMNQSDSHEQAAQIMKLHGAEEVLA